MDQNQALPESIKQAASEKVTRKNYHAPQLIEWGTLRNVTKGAIPSDQDADFQGVSDTSGLDAS